MRYLVALLIVLFSCSPALSETGLPVPEPMCGNRDAMVRTLVEKRWTHVATMLSKNEILMELMIQRSSGKWLLLGTKAGESTCILVGGPYSESKFLFDPSAELGV